MTPPLTMHIIASIACLVFPLVGLIIWSVATMYLQKRPSKGFKQYNQAIKSGDFRRIRKFENRLNNQIAIRNPLIGDRVHKPVN